jgi:DNA-binding CsgD family transcriptional regulator
MDCLHNLNDDPAPGSPLVEGEDGTSPGDGPEDHSLPVEYPFGLTRRQYEIAMLAHLSSEEIAERLTISENTVNSHMKLIFRKLKVKSRYEIQHVLGSQEGVPALSARQAEAGGDDRLVITVSISCRGDPEQLRDVLDILLDYTL